jgi:SAM-dependent methyltransferase
VPVAVNHPLFARVFARIVSPVIEQEAAPLRDELLGGLAGRVLEIGAGTGVNFAHYPRAVTEVVACEPERYLRQRASLAAGEATVPVTVIEAVAESLPFPDDSFDAAVAGLVLCSVGDPAAAVAELRRVVRADGELRFLEHVRGSGPRARAQRALDRSGLWPLVGGGCHCGRETMATLTLGGFAVASVRELSIGPSWSVANPWVLGTAHPS